MPIKTNSHEAKFNLDLDYILCKQDKIYDATMVQRLHFAKSFWIVFVYSMAVSSDSEIGQFFAFFVENFHETLNGMAGLML